ncbi:hypothetical protein Tco_0655265 [Tanacetum coccineum]|uniref:K Homology domain-containing protein n=1 Tax=Tanacetum coccineum TaxID=301880 RepID=A0ABQ4X6M4_9ASTR
MTPTQALTAIQPMADHSQKWHDGTSSINMSSSSDIDGLDAVISKLDNLGRDMKKLKENVHAIQVGCQICKDLTSTKNVLSMRKSNHWKRSSVENLGAPLLSTEVMKPSASVNVMPRNIFEYLKLANLRNTNMLVEMADMTKKAPLEIDQLVDEYELVIGKKGHMLDKIWEYYKDVHRNNTYWWHDHGFEEEERDEMVIGIEKYDPPEFRLETSSKEYSLKVDRKVCLLCEQRKWTTLYLSKENGSRFHCSGLQTFETESTVMVWLALLNLAAVTVFHMAQQVIPAAQLTIGRCNNYVMLQSIPCSLDCKIVGQILLDHPLSYALTATADVPVVYLQQFW